MSAEKTAVDAIYNALLSRYIAPRLKKFGFRRNGANFWRAPSPTESNWVMLHFQSSTKENVRQFVVSFGLMSPSLLAAEQWRGTAPAAGRVPKYGQAQITWRLVQGWHERSNYAVESWWAVRPAMNDDELNAIADEVVLGVVNDAIPRVAPLTTDVGLRDLYVRHLDDRDALFAPIDLMYLVALLKATGREDEIDDAQRRGAAAMARSDDMRADFFARAAPDLGEMASEYAKWRSQNVRDVESEA